MTLGGLRVGIMADRKGSEFAAALHKAGALVVHGPTLATVPPEQDGLLAGETEDVLGARPAWVLISTGSGLQAWLEVADRAGRRPAVEELLRRSRTVARGAKGLGALRALGIDPEFVSPQETMRDACGWLGDRVGPGDVIAAQVHGGEVVGTLDLLRPRVRQVLTVAPYRWVLPADRRPAESLVREVVEGGVDVLAATSAPTVRNLAIVAAGIGAREQLIRSLRDRVCVAAVGPVTACAFEELGIAVNVMPRRARTGELIRVIGQWAGRRHLEPGGGSAAGPLELAPEANAVRIGARVVLLGRQEFAVLAAMVRRPGVVIAPEALALEAYGHRAPADASSIKHQVTRVRRKLGPHGRCVQTVRNVGYRYAPGDPGPDPAR